MNTNDVVVVVRDRAQEFDLKHAYIPGSENESYIPSGQNVWYKNTYEDSIDEKVLRNKFKEDYDLIKAVDSSPGDVLMRVPGESEGNYRYIKVNDDDSLNEVVKNSFAEDFRRYCALISKILSVSGAIDISIDTRAKQEHIEQLNQNEHVHDDNVDGFGLRAPTNAGPLNVNVDMSKGREETEISTRDSKRIDEIVGFFKDSFKGNEKVADADEKIRKFIEDAKLEDDEGIKDLLQHLHQRDEALRRRSADLSPIVRLVRWFGWLLGLRRKDNLRASDDTSDGNLIKCELKYKGYERCVENLEKARNLKFNLKVSAACGPYDMEARHKSDKAEEARRAIERETAIVKNLKYSARFREIE